VCWLCFRYRRLVELQQAYATKRADTETPPLARRPMSPTSSMRERTRTPSSTDSDPVRTGKPHTRSACCLSSYVHMAFVMDVCAWCLGATIIVVMRPTCLALALNCLHVHPGRNQGSAFKRLAQRDQSASEFGWPEDQRTERKEVSCLRHAFDLCHEDIMVVGLRAMLCFDVCQNSLWCLMLQSPWADRLQSDELSIGSEGNKDGRRLGVCRACASRYL
jgi:hypothetical protein